MDFFGLTNFGYSDYFKALKRDDYIEPEKEKMCLDLDCAENRNEKLVDVWHNVDFYLQNADGYAYKSLDRLERQRRKGKFKPIGPRQMYRQPLTTAQDIGFWKCDPMLDGKMWYLPNDYFKAMWAPTTRFFDSARKTNKNYQM